MTIPEFYESIGGSYDEVRSRLMKDERILKYLKLFLSGTDYGDLFTALAAEDYTTAFRCSHNLKGVCLNLGLGRYTSAATELCESMRHGKPDFDIAPLIDAVKTQHAFVIAQIRTLTGA